MESSQCKQNDGNVRGNAQSFRQRIYILSYLKNYDEIYVSEDDQTPAEVLLAVTPTISLIWNTDCFGGLKLFVSSALNCQENLLILEKDQAYSIRRGSRGNNYHNNLESWLLMARKHFAFARCNSSAWAEV